MSLASRLNALATAIGTDIKALTNVVQTKSTWYAGAGAPSSGIGQQGDWYMNQMTGQIYHKNPAWSLASMPFSTLGLDPNHVVGAAGEPAFTPGGNWVNYGAGFAPVSFRKDPWGKVKLSGSVKGGATGTVIFTLPVGYRPTSTVRYNPRGSGQGNTTWGQINITTDGAVAAYGDSPSTLISLDGVEFDTYTVAELQVGAVTKQELPAVVTALPGGPTEGQIVRFQTAAMAAAGVNPMHLVYRGAQAGDSKWDCIGGGRMVGIQTGAISHQTASVNVFTAPSNGPTVAIPVRGVYDVRLSGVQYKDAAPLSDIRFALGLDSVGQGIMTYDSRAGQYEGGPVMGEASNISANVGQAFHLLIATSNALHHIGNPTLCRLVVTPIRVG